MASRLISDCSEELQNKFELFTTMCSAVGLKIMLTCTHRTYYEQVCLYAQGRKPLEKVNELRKAHGLHLLKQSENRIVTWTLDSKHCSKPSNAFDIVLAKDKVLTWNLKEDVNENNIPDYLEAAQIGRSIGLVPGAFFKKPDFPHYEL